MAIGDERVCPDCGTVLIVVWDGSAQGPMLTGPRETKRVSVLDRYSWEDGRAFTGESLYFYRPSQAKGTI